NPNPCFIPFISPDGSHPPPRVIIFLACVATSPALLVFCLPVATALLHTHTHTVTQAPLDFSSEFTAP
ncbi:hypothetical protein BVRB_7g176790, partial [Beta vulgaris subsp. vulgaris]